MRREGNDVMLPTSPRRWNALTVFDKKFPWSVHVGLLVCLVLFSIVGPSPLGNLLLGGMACILMVLLIPRIMLVVCWYMDTWKPRDIQDALARGHERLRERREIQRLMPRDFEDGDRR